MQVLAGVPIMGQECRACRMPKTLVARGLCGYCYNKWKWEHIPGAKQRAVECRRQHYAKLTKSYGMTPEEKQVFILHSRLSASRKGAAITLGASDWEDRLSVLCGVLVSLDYVPTLNEVKNWGFIQAHIERGFGKYNNLIRALGLRPNTPGDRAEIVLKRCEMILGCPIQREARFPWLVSPITQKQLPVDGFSETLNLVIEYDDESHFMPEYFEHLPNGQQLWERRQMLDKVKDQLLPIHGLRVVHITYKDNIGMENLRTILGVDPLPSNSK